MRRIGDCPPKILGCELPDSPILYCPFSYADLAVELDGFLAATFPTTDQYAVSPVFDQAVVSELFGDYLLPAARAFVSHNPYDSQGFSKIFTLIRSDGQVIIDIVDTDLGAVMIQTREINQTLTNVSIVRYSSGTAPVLPTPITNATEFSTLKVYSDGRIDVFDPFTTRTEIIQATACPYGWSSRPGIYVTGQLYCVARKITFSSGIQVFYRVSYLRRP